MSKLLRYTQKIFGSSASNNQISEFGSLQAGSPQRYSGSTITPTIVQTLSNYLQGWFGAVEGLNSPAIEDMNAVCFLYAYQLAYLFQQGVAEYDASTTYYTGSLASSDGVVFVSRQDNNTGNLLTDTTKWNQYGNLVRSVTSSVTLNNNDQVILADSTSGNLTITLPPIDNGMGQTIRIKDIGLGGYTTTVQAHGSDVIDLQNIYPTALNKYDSITVVTDGFQWWVV